MVKITRNHPSSVLIALALASSVALSAAGCRRSSRDCGSTPECAEAGLCTMRAGACVAAADSDCAPSRECRVKGACQAREGYCQALTDEACQGAQVCKRFGWCSAKGGACAATGNQDCQRSEACKAAGWCTEAEGICVLGTVADCRQAWLCTEDEPCVIVDGRCVPAAAIEPSADPSSRTTSDNDLRAEMERRMEEERQAADAGVDNQDGALDTNETRSVIEQHRPELVRRCLDPLRSSAPGLEAVRFRLRTTIAPSGKVSSVSVEGGGSETAGARACLTTQVRSWTFPTGREPTDVAWVLVYQPSATRGSPTAAPAPQPAPRPTSADQVFE